MMVLKEKGQAVFTVDCERETRIAFCYPYTLGDLNKIRKKLLSRDNFTEQVLCKSIDENPVYVWGVGTGPLGVWLTCRHHAGETPSSFVLEGLMNELLSPEYCELLDRITFRCCPVVDVDNVQRGAYGKYGPPCDPSMDWGERPVLGTIVFLKNYFAASNETPVLYLDLHSPEPFGSTYVCTWLQNEVTPDYWNRINAFCQCLLKRTSPPLKLDMSRTHGYPEWFHGNMDRSSQGYFKEKYNCLSLTFEISYNSPMGKPQSTQSDYTYLGTRLWKAVADYLKQKY